jgi:hypothetical protein
MYIGIECIGEQASEKKPNAEMDTWMLRGTVISE